MRVSSNSKADRPFDSGVSLSPIPYDPPRTTNSAMTPGQTGQDEDVNGRATVRPSATPVAQIHALPTYTFSRECLPATPFVPLKREADTKTRVVADLLLYPETAISRNIEAYVSATRLSDIPMIPVARDTDGVRCLCGRGDDGTPVVECVLCGKKGHLACYSINQREVDPMQRFFCMFCQMMIVRHLKTRIARMLSQIDEDIEGILQIIKPVADVYDQPGPPGFVTVLIGQRKMIEYEEVVAMASKAVDESMRSILEMWTEAKNVVHGIGFLRPRGEMYHDDENGYDVGMEEEERIDSYDMSDDGN